MPVFNKMVYNGTEYILGGGGNIGEPLNLTVTTSGLDATIKWEDNEIGTIPPTTFQKSELVRKIGSAPTSPSDGDLVVTETVKDTYKVSGYVDSGLIDGTTYYYRVFSYSDLGGISYCDAVSVTVSNQWQPGANTICYYPLDSINTVNDLSGNGYDLTNVGGVTFGINEGVDCGYFNGSYLSIGGVSTIPLGNSARTVSFYCWSHAKDKQYFQWGNTGSDYAFGCFIGGNFAPFISTYSGPGLEGNIDVRDAWHYITLTHDGTTMKMYIDGQLDNSISTSLNTTGNDLYIGHCTWISWDFDKYISNFIVEDIARTAQEIQYYYDQTKGDYGIS